MLRVQLRSRHPTFDMGIPIDLVRVDGRSAGSVVPIQPDEPASIEPGAYRIDARFPGRTVSVERCIAATADVVIDVPSWEDDWLAFAACVLDQSDATSRPLWRPRSLAELTSYINREIDGASMPLAAAVEAFHHSSTTSSLMLREGGTFALRNPASVASGPDLLCLPPKWSTTAHHPFQLVWTGTAPAFALVCDPRTAPLWFAQRGELESARRGVAQMAERAARDGGYLRIATAYTKLKLGDPLAIQDAPFGEDTSDVAIIRASLLLRDHGIEASSRAFELLLGALEARSLPMFAEGVRRLASGLRQLAASPASSTRATAALKRAGELEAHLRPDSLFTWLQDWNQGARERLRPRAPWSETTSNYELRIELERQGEREYIAVARLYHPASSNIDSLVRSRLVLPERPPGIDADREGASIAAALFGDQAFLSQFVNARDCADASNGMLYVRLVAPNDTSMTLRWEALRDPRNVSEPQRLFTGRRVCFARTIPLGRHSKPYVVSRSTTQAQALVAIAAPVPNPEHALLDYVWPTSRVDFEREVTLARNALRGFVPTVLSAPCSLERILAELAENQWDVLYLLCHGRLRAKLESELLLEDERGHPNPVPGARLVEGIQALAPDGPRGVGRDRRPALVYLASCESAGATSGYGGFVALGPRLVSDAGVPAVVAMMDRVNSNTATTFAEAFFEALASHGKVMPASAVARGAIQHCADWWAPVLYTRSDVDRIFDRDLSAENAWELVHRVMHDQLEAMRKYEPEGDLYVSRELEEEVKNFLNDLDQCHSSMMVITGQSGMGKSALIARMLRERYQRGDLCMFVSCAGFQSYSEEQVIRRLLENTNASVTPSDFWTSIDRECARRGRRLIVAIDAVNEAGHPLELLETLDKLGATLRDQNCHRIKLLVSSRPEVWRRGVGTDHVRIRASNSAYHVTNQRIDHVLDRYSEGEASLAFTRYSRFFSVTSSFDELSLLVRSQLRDPLLLNLTCAAFRERSIPHEVDSGRVFEALEVRLRERERHGHELLAVIDALTRAMFDVSANVVERDSVHLDDLRRNDPALFAQLTGELGDALGDLNIIRREGGRIRFTYDRYAEFRISERLLFSIRERLASARPTTRAKLLIASIRDNLGNSFRLTTLFRALRRTLRLLAESEPKFLAVLRELAKDERGLALVVSVMGALAMRGGATIDGLTLVTQLLDGMQARVDEQRSGAPFPVIDIVHRLLLDEEYDAWRRRDETLREQHERMLYSRFEWGIQHPKLAVSTAAVQYLFFLWRSSAGREHATCITAGLVGKSFALWQLISSRKRAFLQNLTGCFMLALAEARDEKETAPILELGRRLFLTIDDRSELATRAIVRLPGVVREFLVKRMLQTNDNPVNYDAFEALFRDRHYQGHARAAIQLLRSDVAWAGITAESLLPIATTPNAVALETFCFALSVRWERLAMLGDLNGKAQHLELLSRLFERGTSSVKYCIALALYHINYFGDHATEDSVRLMGLLVEEILRTSRGRFSFPGSDQEFNTNVIGTYGRVLAFRGDLIGNHRTIPARPLLVFAIEMLNIAKRERRFDDYAYVCDNIGLLGTLAHPRNAFGVIAYILEDLQPGSVPHDADLARVPFPDTWTMKQREQLHDAVMTGLANTRVLYRAEVDRWILDVLENQALYTRIATQETPDFRLSTFYSWTCEHLMYRMLTRYKSVIGKVYLDALESGLKTGKPGQGIQHVVTALLGRLHELASRRESLAST